MPVLAAARPLPCRLQPSPRGHRAMDVRCIARPGRRIAALLATALTLAACGGGSTDGNGPAPTVTLTAPAAFADALTGVVSVTADAAAADGVASVGFEVDGVPVGEPDTVAPYQAAWDTRQFTAGQHVLRARARDAAGRESVSPGVTVRTGGDARIPQGFVLEEPWVGGLIRASAFAQAPDGRFFVAEQDGRVRVVRDGALNPQPFHQFAVDAQGERGLIGIALHPAFARNGLVYVHYTTPQGGAHNRISLLVADPARNGDVSTGAEQVLVDLPPLSAVVHNGGALHFGLDGKLYAGIGDNNDGARAQDPASPLGKLLRLNDDGSIPADNPFAASRSDLFGRAVWASGLRNPFTFAVHPDSGRIHINDVGLDRWEEIDVGAAGANYGWPDSEGIDGLRRGITGPLFVYGHRDATPPGSGPGGFLTGSAIAGGAFYPAGGNFPAAFRDSYFFADFGSRFIARLDRARDNDVSTFATVEGDPVDLRVGTDGALYVLTRDALVRIRAQ